MKKILALAGALALLLTLGGCGQTAQPDGSPSQPEEPQAPGTSVQEEPTGREIAVIDIADYGTIEVELDRSAAPLTVENFVELAESGFYDGLTFHRIISGFMIQGGDPKGNGTGGSDRTIKGEFAENGVDNPISHTRGTISMARSMLADSASSQFFLVHQDAPHLDGSYAAFGHVIQGMEVVDAICDQTPVEDNNGTVLPDNQPVINSVTIRTETE